MKNWNHLTEEGRFVGRSKKVKVFLLSIPPVTKRGRGEGRGLGRRGREGNPSKKLGKQAGRNIKNSEGKQNRGIPFRADSHSDWREGIEVKFDLARCTARLRDQ